MDIITHFNPKEPSGTYDIVNDVVSMKDIDRLEALVNVQGGMVNNPGGPLSYGLVEDIERAQVVGTDGDYDA